jgi:hypothetical protein
MVRVAPIAAAACLGRGRQCGERFTKSPAWRSRTFKSRFPLLVDLLDGRVKTPTEGASHVVAGGVLDFVSRFLVGRFVDFRLGVISV